MSGSMVNKSFGYFEGNRCSLEVVSLEEKKKRGNLFFLDGEILARGVLQPKYVRN